MSEVSHLNINGTTYDIKDEKARKLKTYTLVAAKNSSNDMKAIADYVCTGSNDETTINQAIAATANGGEVVLASGFYRLSPTTTSHIIIDKPITFKGMSSPIGWGIGEVDIQSWYGTAIEVKTAGCTLRDFIIDGDTDYGFDSGTAGILINISNGLIPGFIPQNTYGQNATIENVLIYEKYCGINIAQGNGCRITNCTISCA